MNNLKKTHHRPIISARRTTSTLQHFNTSTHFFSCTQGSDAHASPPWAVIFRPFRPCFPSIFTSDNLRMNNLKKTHHRPIIFRPPYNINTSTHFFSCTQGSDAHASPPWAVIFRPFRPCFAL